MNNKSGKPVHDKANTDSLNNSDDLEKTNSRLRSKIAELKEAMDEVLTSENRYKSAIEATGLGLWDANLKTRKVIYNNFWKRKLGLPLDQVEFDIEIWFSRIHPEDLERVKTQVEKHHHQKEGSFDLEYRVRDITDKYIWVLDQGKITELDENGESTRATGTNLDIDKRKKAEIALTESRELITKAFRVGLDALVISKLPEGRIIEVNYGFSKLSGYAPDEVIGRTGTELGLWVNLEDREEIVKKLMAEGEVSNLKIDFYRKDGKVMNTLFTSALIDISGENHMLANVHDITDLREMETKLQETEKLEAVRKLACAIAHEFRQPMAMLKLISDIVSLENTTVDEIMEKSRRISEIVKRMDDLVEHLLTITSLEIKKYALDLNILDLQKSSEVQS